jgi:hypothetical protein
MSAGSRPHCCYWREDAFTAQLRGVLANPSTEDSANDATADVTEKILPFLL